MKDLANLYRNFDVNVNNLSNEKVAVVNMYREIFKIYPEETIQVLMDCKEFRSLEDHVLEYLRKQQRQLVVQPVRSPVKKLRRYLVSKLVEYGGELPIPDREVQAVKRQLEAFVKDGFVISKEELHKKVKDTISDCEVPVDVPEGIKIFGIPTRNRGKLLTRCVQSFTMNVHQNHRECVIHIVDDSDDKEDADHQSRAIEELCRPYQVKILWVDKSYRHQLAEDIAKAGDIPVDVTKFALLGDLRCGFRVGTSRNMLLLLAAGERSVQVDDDIVCSIMPSPEIDTGMALSSGAECNEYWFCKNGDTITEQEWQEETDFLSLHETLLGKHPAALFKDHKKVNIDRLGGALLENLGQPETRIAVTYSGVLGDSGMYWHWPRLLLEGDSFRRLVEDASTYTDSMRTRQMLRGAVQPTIGDNPFCMAGNIGLDTRRLLPPFMPVQRNEDGIFGQLLYLCFKQACRGYLPYAILHDPPVRSSHASPSHTLSVGPLRTNDILGAVLWSQSRWPFGPDPSHNISVLGQYLFDLSQCSIHHFKIKLREICWGVTRTRINHFKQHIEKRVDVPEYWQRDARQVVSNFQELMLNDLCVPCDLPGNASERLKVFQELLGKFGQLLMYWPDIWKAATEINVERGLENR